jgi:hypothetical protein
MLPHIEVEICRLDPRPEHDAVKKNAVAASNRGLLVATERGTFGRV